MPRKSARRDRHFLILEPDIEGHPREWLQHLIHYAITKNFPHVLWIVVSRKVFRDLVREIPPELRLRICLVALHPREQAWCAHRSLAIRSFARWRTLRRYLERTDSEAAHVQSLDLLTLPLAIGLGAAGRRVGGVLFRPSVHYRTFSPIRPFYTERIRDFRKEILYRLMLLNRAVREVLSLDPFFPEYASHHYVGGFKVRPIADPVYPQISTGGQRSTLATLVPQHRVCFALFGHLTERKGVLMLLDALAQLSPSIAEKTAILLAGRVADEIRVEMSDRLRSLASVRPEIWLHLEDRWLTSAELDTVVRLADVILAPYQRFVGSSGVLLWAARAGKPLLTQDFGLVGRLVSDHRLGLALNVGDELILAGGIERMIAHGPANFIDQRAAREFIASHSPEAFASTIFASLLNEREKRSVPVQLS